MAQPRQDDLTHFGARSVALDHKQGLVDEVFSSVASRYDLMNDLMSGGLHRLWKDVMVQRLAPPKKGARPYRVLDLAGGTGDIAERIADASNGFADITVADINAQMLAEGERRKASWRYPEAVEFTLANAEELPFDDDRFDAVTIAFGIRNVPRIEKALAQIHRTLKPGGRFLCLEFSTVDLPGLDRLYRAYSDRLIPQMGKRVAGDADPYTYLVESIRNFPGPAAFTAMIGAAGLSRVTHTALTGNIAALHGAWKI